MNKFIIFISLLVMTSSTFANFNIDVNWKQDKTKSVKLQCEKESSTMCQYICGESGSCEVQEEFCYNCIGNNLFIVNFYKNIGKNITNTGYEFHWSKLINPFVEKNFITLKANSIYNIISEYDSKKMKNNFKNLCPTKVKKDPIVFVEVNRDRLPTDFMFVVCDQELYELTQIQEIYQSQPALD